MTTQPEPRGGIWEISPYVPGDSTLPGFDLVIKLSSNESPMGPAQGVRDAISNGLANLEHYPNPDWTDVRTGLAALHGIDAGRVLVDSGSERLIHLLAQIFAGPGDEIIQTQYGFLAYPIAASASGATLVRAKVNEDFRADIDEVLSAVTPSTKLVFFDNPNNPSGTLLPISEIRRLREGLPQHVLLVLDAAYAEYVDDAEYSAGHELVSEAIENGTNNVIVLHTFSKIYGLAAMRVGWADAPPYIVDIVNRVRVPFNVPSVTQAAAVAAIEDQAHVASARAHNATWREKLRDHFRGHGCEVPEAHGNFVLAKFPGGSAQAAAFDAFQRKAGIIVRPLGAYDLKDCLRISVGSAKDCTALMDRSDLFFAG